MTYIKIKWPFKITMVGKTGTGKTTLVKSLITNGDIELPQEIFIICNPNSIYQWHGFPFIGRDGQVHHAVAFEPKNFPEKIAPFTLVILDDIDVLNNQVADIFTTRSHHNNLSVIVIVHKVNTSKPETRTSSDFMVFTGDVNLVETSLKQLGEKRHICKIIPYMTKNRVLDFNVKEFRNVCLSSNDNAYPYWSIGTDKIRPQGLKMLEL